MHARDRRQRSGYLFGRRHVNHDAIVRFLTLYRWRFNTDDPGSLLDVLAWLTLATVLISGTFYVREFTRRALQVARA